MLVHARGPCGSLPWTLLWGWEFLLLPPQPPRVFSIRGLRLNFPVLEPWVVWSVSLPPLFLPVYLCANVGPQGLPATTSWGLLAAAWPAQFHNLPPRWVHEPPPCCESSPPLLQVWMNVSSLFPWLSEFHTVLFSVSSSKATEISLIRLIIAHLQFSKLA